MLQDWGGGGSSQQNLTAAFNVSQSVVSPLWNHFQTIHLVDMLDALGKAVPAIQPHAKTTTSSKWLSGAATKLRKRQATGVSVTMQTVHNRLHKENGWWTSSYRATP